MFSFRNHHVSRSPAAEFLRASFRGAGVARFSSAADSFAGAQQRLQTLKESPGNDVKLKLYALFKQATVGQVDSKRPGMTNFVGRAKWDAWNTLGSMTQVYNSRIEQTA